MTEKCENRELKFLNCYFSLSVAAGHGLVEKESSLFRRKFTFPSCRHFPYILSVSSNSDSRKQHEAEESRQRLSYKVVVDMEVCEAIARVEIILWIISY